MTYPAQVAQNIFVGNGVTTTFAYTFGIPFQPDNPTVPAANVFLVTPGSPTIVTPLVYNTDYTLSNVGNDVSTGGNLVTTGVHSPAPSGAILIIQRALDLAQDSTFPNQGFLPVVIEQQFDQIMQALQQTGMLPDMSKVNVVSGLPAANLLPFGRRFVLDATATTFGSVVAGGGTNTVPVFSDGVNWRIG